MAMSPVSIKKAIFYVEIRSGTQIIIPDQLVRVIRLVASVGLVPSGLLWSPESGAMN